MSNYPYQTNYEELLGEAGPNKVPCHHLIPNSTYANYYETYSLQTYENDKPLLREKPQCSLTKL